MSFSFEGIGNTSDEWRPTVGDASPECPDPDFAFDAEIDEAPKEGMDDAACLHDINMTTDLMAAPEQDETADHPGSVYSAFDRGPRLTPQQTAELTAVYGPDSVAYIEEQAYEEGFRSGGLSTQELIAAYKEAPTPTITRFSRPHVISFADDVAPDLAGELDRPLRIADVGCGPGITTYDIAARLDMPHKVSGFDVNPEVLQESQMPYDCHSWDGPLEAGGHSSDNNERYYQQFHTGQATYIGYEVSPSEDLKQRVDFAQLDIITTPLGNTSSEPYDVVVLANVLRHYPPQTRTTIMINALDGLASGGRFVMEDISDHLLTPLLGLHGASPDTLEFISWVNENMHDFGLVCDNPDKNNILRFDPSSARPGLLLPRRSQ